LEAQKLDLQIGVYKYQQAYGLLNFFLHFGALKLIGLEVSGVFILEDHWILKAYAEIQ